MIRIVRRYILNAGLRKRWKQGLTTTIILTCLFFFFIELLRQPVQLTKPKRPVAIIPDQVLAPIRDVSEKCILPFFKQTAPKLPLFATNCTQLEDNWVVSTQGVFKINEETKKKYLDVKCALIPILRSDDNTVYYGEAIEDMVDKKTLPNDIFVANCESEKNKKQYQLLHAGISKLKLRGITRKNELDIIIIGLDSVSNVAWKKYLPNTLEVFLKEMKGIVFEKFNILGDGTTHNLIPLLTGFVEEDLYESRRGFNSAKPVDDYPWLWKEFQKRGYVTQWGEDGSKYGTFQYRLMGFKEPPVDHYMRPFYLKLDELYPHRKFGCIGSLPLHKLKLDWQKDFLDIYKERRKFSFIFHSELSHEDNLYLSPMDIDLADYLRALNSSGYLNHSMVILMSDHGHRYSKTRETLQGKYEERLPFLGIYLPNVFKETYPNEFQNFVSNKDQLITPLDVHATISQTLRMFSFEKSKFNQVIQTNGTSLFTKLETRNCPKAGIAAHWCSCLAWKSMNPLGTEEKKLANEAVQLINGMTKEYRSRCAELTFSKLFTAESYEPSESVMKFKKSQDPHGRTPENTDTMVPGYTLYQLTLETLPNKAHYEVTLEYDKVSGTLHLQPNSISRINAYGRQPECIQNKAPHLRSFCYCPSKIK